MNIQLESYILFIIAMVYGSLMVYMFYPQKQWRQRDISDLYNSAMDNNGSFQKFYKVSKKTDTKKEKKVKNSESDGFSCDPGVESTNVNSDDQSQDYDSEDSTLTPLTKGTIRMRRNKIMSYPGIIMQEFAQLLDLRKIKYRIGEIPAGRENHAQNMAISSISYPVVARELDIYTVSTKKYFSCDLVFKLDNTYLFVEAKLTNGTNRLRQQTRSREDGLQQFLLSHGIKTIFSWYHCPTRQFYDSDGRILKPPSYVCDYLD